MIQRKTIESKSFKYKASITGSTYNVSERITIEAGNEILNPDYDAYEVSRKEVEITVPFKIFEQFLESVKHAFNSL